MSKEIPIWRLSFGFFRHLGLSSSGRVLQQSTRVDGEGRLAPVGYALVVNTETGRLAVDFTASALDEGFLCDFWRSVVKSGHADLGPMTSRVVVSRSATAGMSELLCAISSSGPEVFHGRASFKDGVHAGRSFEDMLSTWFLRHSLFGLIKNWRPLWPKVVRVYNDCVALPESDRYEVISLAEQVTAELGECPRKAALEGPLTVTESRFERGLVNDREFSNAEGGTWAHTGHYWRFRLFGDEQKLPLYFATSRGGGVAAIRLEDVLVPSEVAPTQFRSLYRMDRPDPGAAISLGVAATQLAKRAWGVADQLEWIDGLASAFRESANSGAADMSPTRPCYEDAKLTPELARLGLSSGIGHWGVGSGKRLSYRLPVYWSEPTLGTNAGGGHRWSLAGTLEIHWDTGSTPFVRFSPEYSLARGETTSLSETVGHALARHPRPIIKESVIPELEKEHPKLLAEWQEQNRIYEEKAAKKKARALITEQARAAARNMRPPEAGYDQFVARAYRRELAQTFLPVLAPHGRCDIPLPPGFVFRSPYSDSSPRILAVAATEDRLGLRLRLDGADYRGQALLVAAESLDAETLHAVLSLAARQISAAGSRR